MADFELRPAGSSDITAVAALIRHAESYDGVPRALADEELVEDLAAPYVEAEADTRVAVSQGQVVGWALVWHPPAEHRLDRAELYGEVAPEHRGRGIGRALLSWSLVRAQERLVDRQHRLDRFIRVNAYDWLEDRHRLYRRAGFAAVRWHDELLRPLHDLPPLRVPSGLSLVQWPDDRDEEIRVVRNAAFADHWGSTVVEHDLWHQFTRGRNARPDLSVVAVDDRTAVVVGFCSNQVYPEDAVVTGRRDAWIANVGTVRAARGRGVASAMIAWSLEVFAAAGLSHALLDVDTSSPTGADRLYRNLGFAPHLRSITYEIEV